MTHIENFIYRAMEHHYQQSASIGHKTPTFIKSFVNEEVERGLIKATLEFTGANLKQTSKILGISMGLLKKKMYAYDMHRISC